MKRFIQEIKENKLSFLVNLLIRLSIFFFLAEVILLQDDPRFAGKAIPIRNLVIVLTFSLLFPVFYFLRRKWKKYPVWFDNLYLSIFWFDMAGNSLDLYDTYFYFDLFPHLHGTGTFASFLFGAFNFTALKAILLANLVHSLLEGQEIFTDIFFGTHNVRGAFDSINDIIVGLLGTLLYTKVASKLLVNKTNKLKIFILLLISFLLLIMFFHKNIAASVRSIFLVSNTFPQVPLRPLALTTHAPLHTKIDLSDRVIADLFLPQENYTPKSKKRKPALIVAMGVKTSEKDKPAIFNFSNTLSRLGFVVLWPRLKVLDQGISQIEQPDTFVTAFKYLESQEFIDSNRISFVGFSVGSSIAFAAASDPVISKDVNSLVFFGGYYDIFDYLDSLQNESIVIEGKKIGWKPDQGATSHVKEIIEAMDLGSIESIVSIKPNEFKRINPSEHINNFNARIFLLHEKSDIYVPYVESQKLYNALPREIDKKFVLINLFEHVQPRKGFSPEILNEFLKLFGFTSEIFLKL